MTFGGMGVEAAATPLPPPFPQRHIVIPTAKQKKSLAAR